MVQHAVRGSWKPALAAMSHDAIVNNCPSEEARSLECVEIYIPKNLNNLSLLYQYLRRKALDRSQAIVLDGFSLYEVDGAFVGQRLHEERTLVVRILITRRAGDDAALAGQIAEMGREVASTVALAEEELWVCHYPQNAMIVRLAAASRATGMPDSGNPPCQ